MFAKLRHFDFLLQFENPNIYNTFQYDFLEI